MSFGVYVLFVWNGVNVQNFNKLALLFSKYFLMQIFFNALNLKEDIIYFAKTLAKEIII